MAKLTAVNDYFLVELQADGPWAGQKDPEEGVRRGKVIGISDFLTFFGFNTFMFDKSLMDEELLTRLYDKYKQLVGKVVWWPERSETGALVNYNNKQYVFLKWSAIMAVEED